jgi:predicted phage terminase large subunit-like protein
LIAASPSCSPSVELYDLLLERARRQRRRAARDSLEAFCSSIEIPGAPISDDDECEAFKPISSALASHHALLVRKLEAVERGELRRLMVFMPPGSAKSTYASVVFPVWFMGRQRRRNVIVATYATDLARKIGRRARSIVKQPVFAEIFDSGLSQESGAADEWALTNENEWMGGGILSGITGNRADLLVIDDPVKGRQEADSETIRERTKAEYEDSLRTRLKPGGRIVLIQTRWHEDDLAGSILPEGYDGESGPIVCRDGETWEVLCLPAEARANDPLGRAPGEMLWPEWFDEQHWRAFRGQGRTWAALYQQQPQPDDGSFFRREWFRRYRPDELPRALRVYGTSDYAVTDDGGDYTCLRLWGVDEHSRIWLIGGWRGQTSADMWIERQVDLIRDHRPFAWFGEAGVIQKAIEPMLRRRMFERKTPCRLEWLPSIADKPTRARGIQSRAAMGMVAIPEGAEGDAFLSELLRFPAGKHDDDVDCASLIGRALDDVHPAIVAPEKPAAGTPQGVGSMTFDQILKHHDRTSDRSRI